MAVTHLLKIRLIAPEAKVVICGTLGSCGSYCGRSTNVNLRRSAGQDPPPS